MAACLPAAGASLGCCPAPHPHIPPHLVCLHVLLLNLLPQLRRLARGGGDAPNLVRLLADPAVVKLFHFARFDIAVLRRFLGVDCRPVYCTKVAAKLVRTFTDKHGLKDVAREVAGIDMSKAQQSSDWGAAALTDAQIQYAASDVLYLHQIKAGLEAMLVREGRMALAEACFGFLPVRAELDLAGWGEEDIFSHS